MDDIRFEKAVVLVLMNEGGYVNDPDDPGGETNFGISKRSYPHLNIEKLTRSEAVEIYERDWWIGCNIRHIENDTLAFKVFDIAVNVGAKRAGKWLQQAVVIGGKNIAVDGIIGAATIKAANETDAAFLLIHFMHEAYNHYQKLAQKHPQYIDGWINRLWKL